jgi:hypothetical protein
MQKTKTVSESRAALYTSKVPVASTVAQADDARTGKIKKAKPSHACAFRPTRVVAIRAGRYSLRPRAPLGEQ